MRDLESLLNALGRGSAPEGLAGSILKATGVWSRRARIATPIGDCWVWFNRHGIEAVRPAGASDRGEVDLPPDLARRLDLALQGRRVVLPFDLRRVRAFEGSVLEAARAIPFGEVRSYAWVAKEIGRPLAVRAVGTALAHNPIPLFIPCHRVIRSDGDIGQYSAGGAVAKHTLLIHEGVPVDRLRSLGGRGVRYLGDRRRGEYCLPGCRAASRTGDKAVELRSEFEARLLGLVPCPRCRPSGVDLRSNQPRE